MTDIHQTYNQPQHTQHQLNISPRVHQAVKTATAGIAGGSRLILLGLILVWTVIALTIATPVLVIFSPVLVPAAITMFLLEAAFSTSGGFRMAAVAVLSWIYRHATGGGSLDEAWDKLGYKGKELKEGGAEHHQSGGVGVHASADM